MLIRVLVAIFAMVIAAGTAGAQGNYLIKPGDRLAVEVLEDTSLNRQVLVLPDGNISFPMAGAIQAGGRTTGQIERAIASKIASNFSVAPTIYVSVAGLSPEDQATEDTFIVYLVGEVNEPGPKEVFYGTTFLQVLAQSGGFTKFAATKRLQLRRNNPDGSQRLFKVNYRAISQGAQMSGDLRLRKGDVILVPERRLFE
ncbi:polysaccharide biosynthesis/export family protein [Tropicimonas sp. IMCC6043]|uniref:polysaccharide biosynthesis/export family protein n=1 Tax=Tropicimonas sp. IMCC6043 TaxID=2510645 RepID=UPI00101E16E7|nr:polysaccharide biosynthesis/export family protein [Tropicimonas sp. IMCC6043]RYH09994.1 polysaccharide export protein [Tropicimonas sp. IMCC6043]